MKTLPWIFIFLAFSLIAGGLYWVFYFEMPPGDLTKETWQEIALRGDFWGGHLTAITSFAGTLLFLAGLLFQTSELKLQREDIQLSREVSKKQVIELEKQTEIAKHQSVVTQIIEIANYCYALKNEYIEISDKQSLMTPKERDNSIKKLKSLRNRILACTFSLRTLIYNSVLSEDEREYFADMTESGKQGEPYKFIDDTLIDWKPKTD